MDKVTVHNDFSLVILETHFKITHILARSLYVKQMLPNLRLFIQSFK